MARSDNWRINKSGLMPVEGAQILKALRKVAGAAGLPKNYKVKFATKDTGSGINFDDKEVMIGAGRLFKEAPIPADLFDVLVGLTLHEVGHQQIGTDTLWKSVYKTASGQSEEELFLNFINIGEDIAVESRTRANKNLAEYDEALHNWAVTRMREAQPNKLMEIWLEYALGHKSTKILDLPEHLAEPMQQLVALTGWLRKNQPSSARAMAYRDYWNAVKDTILNPPQPPQQQQEQPKDAGADGQESKASSEKPPAPAPDKQDDKPEPQNDKPEPKESESPSNSGADSQSPQEPEQIDVTGTDAEGTSAPESDVDSSKTGNGDKETKESVMDRPLAPKPEDSIDSELAEAIEDAIESDLEDVTEQVAEELGEQQKDGKFHGVSTVIRSRETKTPLVKPDARLRKRLERIMTIRKRLQTRTMHGELYGRIDRRHLHRVATDKRIFSLRFKFPDGFPNTRILIDLSGSMSGREADEVLEAAGALQTLVNAEVWCYNYDRSQVNLVRMDDGKLIHHFKPDGSTPSGLAIVGVALGMKKNGLVIHLTDGEHNHGQAPWSAHWVLQKRGINLVNLIWGKYIKQYNLEGMSFKQLNGLGDFPEALYQILVEQVKLSKIGGK